MGTIAVVDDRKNTRNTVVKAIDLELPDGWNVFGEEPLPQVSDYVRWVLDKHVAAVILDERLKEGTSKKGHVVSYAGHDVACHLRSRLPSLPIFVVTAYPTDDAVEDALGVVEGTFERGDFTKKADKLVDRIVRAGTKYLDEFEKELAEFNKLSTKFADGTLDARSKQRLEAIQAKLGAAYSVENELAAVEILSELEGKLEALEKIKTRLERRTSKK